MDIMNMNEEDIDKLDGQDLDLAVARFTNPQWWEDGLMDGSPESILVMDDGELYSPSTDWAQGGPIMECENIEVSRSEEVGGWRASIPSVNDETIACFGDTALKAAMRVFVLVKVFGHNGTEKPQAAKPQAPTPETTRWFALIDTGEIASLGKFENFHAASDHSDTMKHSAVWILDEETAWRWKRSLNLLLA